MLTKAYLQLVYTLMPSSERVSGNDHQRQTRCKRASQHHVDAHMLSLVPLAYPHWNWAQLVTWLPPQRSKSTILWTTNLVACFQKPNPRPCFNILRILERDNNTLSDKDAIWQRTGMSGHGEIMNLFSVSLYPSIGTEDADAWHVQVFKLLITPNHRPSVADSHPTNGRT
ncbi:hypothetical protein BJ165DRAFT_1406102 [Panaeolus papilionaceus]|nr:hypothetical protein BJ165DRAFT_1406102 [Panaeolus papilionaceus]